MKAADFSPQLFTLRQLRFVGDGSGRAEMKLEGRLLHSVTVWKHLLQSCSVQGAETKKEDRASTPEDPQ